MTFKDFPEVSFSEDFYVLIGLVHVKAVVHDECPYVLHWLGEVQLNLGKKFVAVWSKVGSEIAKSSTWRRRYMGALSILPVYRHGLWIVLRMPIVSRIPWIILVHDQGDLRWPCRACCTRRT